MGTFTFCYLKPHLIRDGGAGILKEIIQDNGFQIVHESMKNLSIEDVMGIYPHIQELYPDDFQNTETVLSSLSGPSNFMVLWHENEAAAKTLRKLIGFPKYPDNPEGEGLRGIYALGRYQNAIHGSDSERLAIREIKTCFSEAIEAILSNDYWKDEFYLALERAYAREQEIKLK
ncbi:nucleoside-diphosphate kinase [Patescibacteria group bacterium]|nr:hypothetical protein [Candidatus Dojkabacteria bacterium]CAG1020950.1 nucleoside-diphosphate kinase [Patescibacteria group bacterium]